MIVCRGLASGLPCPDEGSYLEWYDPSSTSGDVGGWTRELASAKKYADLESAVTEMLLSFRNRPDGKPDRPLSAYNLEFKRLSTIEEAAM